MSRSHGPKGLHTACLAGLALLVAAGAASAAPAVPPAPATPPAHTVTFDRHSLIIDGKPTYLWSGSFHYWRLPSPALWKDVLQKMKAAGFNAVEIYFDWGYHSPKRGVYDFTGIRDVDRLLDMARDVGIYVIARPGPYINAETDAGGFPGWLVTTAGKPRSTSPEYTAAYREWMTQIDRILARHQVTDGRGTVLLYQVENEFYNDSDDGRAYMQALEDKAREDGITVPLFGNHNTNFFEGVGKLDMPGYDSYPMDFDCTKPERWNGIYDFASEREGLKKTPLFFPEYQGGAFDVWGGPGYEACRKLTGPEFERVFYEATIASGSTMQNFYMTYGGINWGWLSSPGVYTSYDYGAAITASRQLTSKYDQQKLIGYMTHAAAPLARTDAVGTPVPANPRLRVTARVNPDNGTRFYILRHAEAQDTTDDATHLTISLDGKGNATTIPQAPGTAIHINGRDSKVFLANYHFSQQDLAYSTSELLTQLRAGDRHIAVFYGRHGEDGETVLRYADRPDVRIIDGNVATQWDAKTHSLRLNYRHDGLARVEIRQGGNALLLLLGDNEAAIRFWQLDSNKGPVLLRGPYLARTAAWEGGTLALTGDTENAGDIEVFAPTGTAITWNGAPVTTSATASTTLLGHLDGPAPVTLPALTTWHVADGAPELTARFDDHAWQLANRTSTPNPYWDHKLPILDSDAYGFHHGHVWYRGHFKATGTETAIRLSANLGVHLGNHGIFTAWINGHFLGNNPSGSQQFPIDPSWLKRGEDNVVAVLTENTGHLQEEHNGAFREPRGLIAADLKGSAAPITWKIQGNAGGEDLPDAMRGPFNAGASLANATAGAFRALAIVAGPKPPFPRPPTSPVSPGTAPPFRSTSRPVRMYPSHYASTMPRPTITAPSSSSTAGR